MFLVYVICNVEMIYLLNMCFSICLFIRYSYIYVKCYATSFEEKTPLQIEICNFIISISGKENFRLIV